MKKGKIGSVKEMTAKFPNDMVKAKGNSQGNQVQNEGLSGSTIIAGKRKEMHSLNIQGLKSIPSLKAPAQDVLHITCQTCKIID